MSTYDHQFELVQPSLDRVIRVTRPVGDTSLIDPSNANALLDGEFLQYNASYQLIRGTAPAIPSFALIEDRGDTGMQAARKLSVIQHGGYEADTIVFNPAVVTLGAALMLGTVNNAASGSVDRSGLIAWTAAPNLVIGFVTRVAANNGGRLRFIQTLV